MIIRSSSRLFFITESLKNDNFSFPGAAWTGKSDLSRDMQSTKSGESVPDIFGGDSRKINITPNLQGKQFVVKKRQLLMAAAIAKARLPQE